MKTILLTLLLCGANFAAPKVEIVAGIAKAGFSGDGGPATQAGLNNPYGLVVGPGGALFICDMGNHRIRKIDANGIITTVAGNGVKGWSGDGGPALAAALNEPYEIRFDREGNMFFVEMRNAVVRRVDAKTGIISTVAGSGKPGFSGDGGAATNAMLNQPHSIQFVGGQLWICDIGNHRLRAVDLKSGIIETVGGTGAKSMTREGEPLKNNPLNGPRAIDVDASGNIWLALREGNAIYRIDGKTQIVRRVLGKGLSGPKGITIAPNGLVIWADTESHSVRYFDPMTTHVEVLAAGLARPHGVFADAAGLVWIGDSENHRVIKVNLVTGVADAKLKE